MPNLCQFVSVQQICWVWLCVNERCENSTGATNIKKCKRTGTTLIILLRLFNTRCIMNFDFPPQRICVTFAVCLYMPESNYMEIMMWTYVCLKRAYRNIRQQIQCPEPFEITVLRSALTIIEFAFDVFVIVDFASRNIIHFAIENDEAWPGHNKAAATSIEHR